MPDDPRDNVDHRSFLRHVDPWAALEDGRRQLIAALDACDPRSGTRVLAIPEFASLGETTGSLGALLLAHAARDRAHAAFFASLTGDDLAFASITGSGDRADDWATVRAEVDAARAAMLEVAALLDTGSPELALSPPWAAEGDEDLRSLLVTRAMCDGILADAIATLTSATSGQ